VIEVTLLSILIRLGVGGIAGFAVGYAIKKAVKVSLLLFGLFWILLMYLDYEGLITIHYDAFYSALSNLTSKLTESSSSFLNYVLSNLSVFGGFGVGLVLGLKKG